MLYNEELTNFGNMLFVISLAVGFMGGMFSGEYTYSKLIVIIGSVPTNIISALVMVSVIVIIGVGSVSIITKFFLKEEYKGKCE